MIDNTIINGNSSAPGLRPYSCGPAAAPGLLSMMGNDLLPVVETDLFPVVANDLLHPGNGSVHVGVAHSWKERQRQRPVGIILRVRELAAPEAERVLIVRMEVHGTVV